MTIMSKIYTFDCFPMPYTEKLLGCRDIGNQEIAISIELSCENICNIISMLHWAWDNNYFDLDFSEKRYAKLFKEKIPELYEQVYSLAHLSFSNKYPNSINISGFGEYEIFPPDEILQDAIECYPNRKERFGI